MTAAMGSPMQTAMDDDSRGVLYRGGRIRTADPARPAADAVATRDGRILVVGSEEQCLRALGLPEALDAQEPSPPSRHQHHAGATAEHVVDLEGRALLPGFIDAHMHPLVACVHTLHVDLSPLRWLSEVLDALSDRARMTPPGEWVIGLRLCPHQLAERRLPTLAELDAVGAGRPVVLVLGDAHTTVGNSLALAAAGIWRCTEDPPGGRFDRDEHGQLTGVCHENATAVLMSAVPTPDLEEIRSASKGVFADLSARGITSIGAVLQTDAEGPHGAVRELECVGMTMLVHELPQGLYAILCGNPTRAADMRTSMSLHQPEENRYVGAVKLFLDGTLNARTAWLHEPYSDRPGDRGLLRTGPDTVASRMEQAHVAGLQACVHAVGDAAASQALTLLAELERRHPRDPGAPPRHRIEHISVLDSAAVERFAELDIVAVVQPEAVPADPEWLVDRLGPQRARRAFPFRTLVEAGVVVAGSSDSPTMPADPLAGMAAAVERAGLLADEALSGVQAVELYTRNAATAQRRDGEAGTISEGKRADLVVLSGDPAEARPGEIAGIEVCQTVIGGRVVHRSPQEFRSG